VQWGPNHWYINCNGDIQTVLFTNPEQLRCQPDDRVAIANFAGLPSFGATAYFTDTSGNAIPSGSGVVEASITAQGAFEVTFNPNQPEPSLFFEFCITSVQSETFPGSTATVSATLGPWTLNEPCDLAHAVPYVAGTPFVFQADEYVSAENGTEVGLLSMPMWFDSSGQQVFGSLTIQPVADIPEPTQTLSSIATIAAMALLRLRSPIRR